MPSVVVYSRPGCHLCENVIAELERIKVAYPAIDISIEDITADPILFNRFHNLIPAVSVEGKIKLAGVAFAGPRTLRDMLRKAIFDRPEKVAVRHCTSNRTLIYRGALER